MGKSVGPVLIVQICPHLYKPPEMLLRFFRADQSAVASGERHLAGPAYSSLINHENVLCSLLCFDRRKQAAYAASYDQDVGGYHFPKFINPYGMLRYRSHCLFPFWVALWL